MFERREQRFSHWTAFPKPCSAPGTLGTLMTGAAGNENKRRHRYKTGVRWTAASWKPSVFIELNREAGLLLAAESRMQG